MLEMWNWLVANGLFRDLESACILVPIMRFMGSKMATRIGQEVAKAAKDAAKEAAKEVDRV